MTRTYPLQRSSTARQQIHNLRGIFKYIIIDLPLGFPINNIISQVYQDLTVAKLECKRLYLFERKKIA